MNRTDRLYAIVEELRASSPALRTSVDLAAVFKVSTRTIERDILALQEAGVPVFATPGRRGGYALDTAHTLPPVNFTPAEAVAVAVALAEHRGPFAAAGRQARHKLMAAMADDDAEAARALATRVRRYTRDADDGDDRVRAAIGEAIAGNEVLHISYVDSKGADTTRAIEPVGVIDIDGVWYLSAWCRLRDDVRVFRIERVAWASPTGELAPVREPEVWIEQLPWLISQPAPLA